jgi:hypothetical protein
LLGVKPGVSLTELKAAHRDLAKVWHPDRFLHDPRLMEKAQEKLKEINEAYEQISSGKVPRSVNPQPTEPQNVRYTAQRGINWPWAAVVLLVFAAVFAVTTRTLLQQRRQPLTQETAPAEEPARLDDAQSTRPDSNTRAEVKNTPPKSNPENAAPEVAPQVSVATEPKPAITTVTVLIDPETGLLAKPECPLRSRITYPSGSQPTGYCNRSHAPPPKKSRLKSLASKVLP